MCCVLSASRHWQVQSGCLIMGDVNLGYLVKVSFTRFLQGGGTLSPLHVIRDLLGGILRLCDYPVPPQSFMRWFSIQWHPDLLMANPSARVSLYMNDSLQRWPSAPPFFISWVFAAWHSCRCAFRCLETSDLQVGTPQASASFCPVSVSF